jgi:hypothetical protein
MNKYLEYGIFSLSSGFVGGIFYKFINSKNKISILNQGFYFGFGLGVLRCYLKNLVINLFITQVKKLANNIK